MELGSSCGFPPWSQDSIHQTASGIPTQPAFQVSPPDTCPGAQRIKRTKVELGYLLLEPMWAPNVLTAPRSWLSVYSTQQMLNEFFMITFLKATLFFIVVKYT